MTNQTMYDKQFGLDGMYAWPADLDVAERLIDIAPDAKSSFDCLNDGFFYEDPDHHDRYFFDDYSVDEAKELAKIAAKSRQELFKEARYWPLSYLVASAVYKIFSTEGVYVSSNLIWVFLCFDELISDMFRSKGWNKKRCGKNLNGPSSSR